MIKKTHKQIAIEKAILSHLEGKSAEIAKMHFQRSGNTNPSGLCKYCFYKTLGFNDHGPVHMRTAALNALIMFDLLHDAGIKLNLESEKLGTYEDSELCVLTASLLHDIGMTATRDHHEIIGIIFAEPIIRRLLDAVYKDNIHKKTILKAMIIEGIFGHMATEKDIFSRSRSRSHR